MRYVCALVVLLAQAAVIAYCIVRLGSTDPVGSQRDMLRLYFLAFVKLYFLLLVCDFQRYILSQNKNSLYYFAKFFFDFLLIFGGALLMIYSDSLTSVSAVSLSIDSMAPLLALKAYNYFHWESH